jgi:hypothetical protein
MARRRPGFRSGRGFAQYADPAQPPVQTSPPPGSYDPAIDAQVGQSNRGLADFLSDYIRDFGEPGTALGGRAGEDLTLGKADVERGYGRNLTDILTSRSRAGEDYGHAVEGLNRNFAQLGAQQTQAARAAGVQRGGALAQALAKRAENQRIAREPMDTNFARYNADSSQAEGRLGEDRGLALGALDRGFLRGSDDAATALARGQRENTAFGLDATAQKFYQADLPLPLPGAQPSSSSSSTGGTKPRRRPYRPFQPSFRR